MRQWKAAVIALVSAVAVAQEPETDENDSGRSSGRSGRSGSTYRGGGNEMTSVLSGKALSGATVVHAQFGWPGISATLLTSASENVDIGARFSVLYAYEGITGWSGVPGIKLQGVLRLELLELDRINLGLAFSPGLFSYFYGGASWVGLTLPIDVSVGFALSPQLMLSVGLNMPIFVAFGASLVTPVMLGVGLEYALDRSLALTASLRAGPTPYGWDYGWGWGQCYDPFYDEYYGCGGGYYYYTAEAMIGLTYRL
jgi:hypothetical protein